MSCTDVCAPVTGAQPGWRAVAGAFVVLTVGFGAIYSYAAFAEPIAAEFGLDRAAVTVVYALAGGTCYLVSAVTGRVADRIGPRVPAVLGMLLVGLGLVVAATATTIMEVYAGYGLLIGLGAGFAYVPAVACVQGWFTAHRGLASGVAASGVGVGMALVPPVADGLLALGDWRLAFVLLGAGSTAAGVAGALLLAATPRVPQPSRRLPDRRPFLAAWCSVLLIALGTTLPPAMLAGTARDLGLDKGAALGLLGLLGLGTIAGRLLLPALADAAGRRVTFLVCAGGMTSSLFLWAFATEAATLQGFALLFGLLHGGFVALLPAFIADRFGAGALGAVLGALYTSRGLALLAGPPAFAAGIAAMGSHVLPIAVAALCGLAGTALLARLR